MRSTRSGTCSSSCPSRSSCWSRRSSCSASGAGTCGRARRTSTARPTHGSTRLEVIWTAIPTIIIAALCAYATVLLLDIQESPAKGTRVVKVLGQQFAWSFETNEGGKKIVSDRLVLPVGEPVAVQGDLEGRHPRLLGPGVPAEGRRRPGRHQRLLADADRVGRYQVVCAELCGLGHAFMRQYVRVVTPAAYAAWVRAQSARPPPPRRQVARSPPAARPSPTASSSSSPATRRRAPSRAAAATRSRPPARAPRPGPNLDEASSRTTRPPSAR